MVPSFCRALIDPYKGETPRRAENPRKWSGRQAPKSLADLRWSKQPLCFSAARAWCQTEVYEGPVPPPHSRGDHLFPLTSHRSHGRSHNLRSRNLRSPRHTGSRSRSSEGSNRRNNGPDEYRARGESGARGDDCGRDDTRRHDHRRYGCVHNEARRHDRARGAHHAVRVPQGSRQAPRSSNLSLSFS